MSKPLLGTPEHIKAKSVEVLRPLAGLSYADALYVLETAQRTLADAVDRLHAEQVFDAPVFQDCSPRNSEELKPAGLTPQDRAVKDWRV